MTVKAMGRQGDMATGAAPVLLRMMLVTMLLNACAVPGMGGSGSQGSALERSIAGCALSVGLGAGFDLFASGKKKKRLGAGTAIGAAACAVLLAVNTAEDKRRIAANQEAAARTGQTRSEAYRSDDGAMRTVSTTVREAALPGPLAEVAAPGGGHFIGPCRYAQTSIATPQQGSATLDPELFCRTDRGDWPRWPGQAPA